MYYKGLYLIVLLSILGIGAIACSVEKNESKADEKIKTQETVVYQKSSVPIDSLSIVNFFITYPNLKKYESEVMKLYQKHKFTQVWHDSDGTTEFSYTVFDKYINIESEGVKATFPYEEQLNLIFDQESENTLSQADTDVMITSLFMFYEEKVVAGIDEKSTQSIGWLLPRKEVSYAAILDSTLLRPDAINKDTHVMIGQYYKLRDVLQKYRTIEKNGGWNSIELDPKLKEYKVGDTASAVLQIKERLIITGDLKENNKTNKFDTELLTAVNKYQKRNGKIESKTITPNLINEMNVPISERIKTIIVNMERCRWMSPEIKNAREFVLVNIPSYNLAFIRDKKVALTGFIVNA